MVKTFLILAGLLAVSMAQLPHDPYHALHLPGAYSRYVHHYNPHAGGHFSCEGRPYGLHADLWTGCEKYHLCSEEQVVSSHVCTEGTLFNEQFQICDHFYNVRCGSPYEDL